MSDTTEVQETNPAQPLTMEHWIRLIGTIILLLVAFWATNFWQPEVRVPTVEYNAATLTPEQIARRDEILARYQSLVDVVEVRGETRYLYNIEYKGGEYIWRKNRPSFLDENNQPMLDEQDKRHIAEVAEHAIVMEKPAWLMQGGGNISIKEYNLQLGLFSLLVWVGLASSLVVYSILFWRKRPKDGPSRGFRRFALFGCLPLVTLLIGGVVFNETQPAPYLIAFGASFLSMFLLWALTRSKKDSDVKGELTEPGEATEPMPG
jgi:hypothetical protein